jgi:hypothetical protein
MVITPFGENDETLYLFHEPKPNNMKKWIIGSIVGAIIVFVWQFASWSFLPIHDKTAKYTDKQDAIMSALTSNITEDGMYMLPSAPTKKEQQNMMKDLEGKPWATVIYHSKMNTDMTMRMIRGFLVDFFLVISLIYVLSRGGTPNRMRTFAGSVALGLFAFLWGDYTGRIWFDLPWHMITGDFIDSIVAWGLCGIWIGWWLNKPGNKAAA